MSTSRMEASGSHTTGHAKSTRSSSKQQKDTDPDAVSKALDWERVHYLAECKMIDLCLTKKFLSETGANNDPHWDGEEVEIELLTLGPRELILEEEARQLQLQALAAQPAAGQAGAGGQPAAGQAPPAAQPAAGQAPPAAQPPAAQPPAAQPPAAQPPAGQAAAGVQAAGTQAAGTQAAGTQAAGTQAAGGQPVRVRDVRQPTLYPFNPWPRRRQYDGLRFAIRPGRLSYEHEGIDETVPRSVVHFNIMLAMKKHDVALDEIHQRRFQCIASSTDDHLIKVYNCLFGKRQPKPQFMDFDDMAFFTVVHDPEDVEFIYAEELSKAATEKKKKNLPLNDDPLADPTKEIVQRVYKRPYNIRDVDDESVTYAYQKLLENRMVFSVMNRKREQYVATVSFKDYVQNGTLGFNTSVVFEDPATLEGQQGQ